MTEKCKYPYWCPYVQGRCVDSIESCGYTDIPIPVSSLNATYILAFYATTVTFSNIAIIHRHHRSSHFAGLLTLD